MQPVILRGVVQKVINNGNNRMTFIFVDENVGELHCITTRGESNFYFQLELDTFYELEVRLVGFKNEAGFISNQLRVKSYKQIEE